MDGLYLQIQAPRIEALADQGCQKPTFFAEGFDVCTDRGLSRADLRRRIWCVTRGRQGFGIVNGDFVDWDEVRRKGNYL